MSFERLDPAAALAKWPNVPACYGWLSLDCRGTWRLQGEPVSHAGLRRLLDHGYTRDASGAWLVFNGPQRVFVRLDYMPLVLRLDSQGVLYTHTGHAAGSPSAAWLDDEGNVLLATPAGPGLLDGRDLASFIEQCTDDHGQLPDEATLLAALAGRARLRWQGLSLGLMARRDAPAHFGFVADPAPAVPA